jgi:hypothetical protein
MMQASDDPCIGRGQIGHSLIGLDLGEILILLDDVPLLHVPSQQFDLRDAFTDVGELEFACHRLTSHTVPKGIEEDRTERGGLRTELIQSLTQSSALMPQSRLLC